MMRSGNVINHKVLIGNIEVDDVVNITLPNIEQQTVELNGAGIGTISMPTTSQIGSMELSITSRSVSKSVLRLHKREPEHEIRLSKTIWTVTARCFPGR